MDGVPMLAAAEHAAGCDVRFQKRDRQGFAKNHATLGM